MNKTRVKDCAWLKWSRYKSTIRQVFIYWLSIFKSLFAYLLIPSIWLLPCKLVFWRFKEKSRVASFHPVWRNVLHIVASSMVNGRIVSSFKIQKSPTKRHTFNIYPAIPLQLFTYTQPFFLNLPNHLTLFPLRFVFFFASPPKKTRFFPKTSKNDKTHFAVERTKSITLVGEILGVRWIWPNCNIFPT